ncbi:hypothetical protein ALC62_07620, partial [Cyphomyrmex costatus]
APAKRVAEKLICATPRELVGSPDAITIIINYVVSRRPRGIMAAVHRHARTYICIYTADKYNKRVHIRVFR